MARRAKQEFAVIGLGRFGSGLALTLEEHGYAVLGIDTREDLVRAIADRITRAVVLDATNEAALRAIDIASFDTVVVAIGSSLENSLMTTMALKRLGVRQVICKAFSEHQEEIFLRLGADRVIRPEHEASQRLATKLIRPGLLENLPLSPGYSIAKVRAPVPLAGEHLQDTGLYDRYGLTVLAVVQGDRLNVSPPPDYVLQQNDLLVLLGRDEDIVHFSRLP